MGTLIGLLGLARESLLADQAAINTTANNVANQNTVGYSRQVVAFSANDAVSLSGFSGDGESVAATVTSQRDRVLEQRLQQQTQSAAQSSTRLNALQNVQSLFGLSSVSSNASTTAIGSALDGFFATLTSLTAYPNDSATRSAVLTAASKLASTLNSAAQGLSSETSSLDAQVATGAAQVNGLTASVAQLNQQISELSPNADAGPLEDQRQLAIKQLSGLLGVNQITTESNGVTLTTSSGAVLVSGSTAYAVSTTNVGGVTQLAGGSPSTVLADVQGGTIGGLMQARDRDIPAMKDTLDQLAFALGTAVNAQNAAGLTPGGAAGGQLFSLPGTAAGAASSISVTLSSADGLATAGLGEGSSGTSNAVALAALASTKIVGGDSATGFFASFIGALGGTVSSASANDVAQAAALTQAQTQRDSLSAVSLDEEASNLTQYQRSYEAAAKVFTIVDQMMTDALNLGQQTAVS